MKKVLLVVFIIGSFLVGDRAAAKVSVLHKPVRLRRQPDDTGNSRIVTEADGQAKTLPAGYPSSWPPEPLYFMGRRTNGLVAPEYLWEAFNPGSPGPGGL